MGRTRAALEARAMSHEILSPPQWAMIQGALQLTDREVQVTQYVFDDALEARMAAGLGISTGTVHTHLDCLYRRFDVHGRPGLIVRVFGAYLALEKDRQRSEGSGR